jgi:hypothetical protein
MKNKVKIVSMVPLVNFECEVNVIELDDNLCLRRITPEELNELIKRAPGYSFPLKNALADVNFVIEKKLSGDYIDYGEFSPYVLNIVLALRLLKEGAIATPTAFRLSSDRKSYSVSEPSPRIRIHPGLSPLYILKKDEISAFQVLWKKLQSLEEDRPHLLFSLEQFSKAFDELFPEDIFVDFISAFESLVFYKEKRTIEPAGKVIGIAIGMLLGKNQQERNRIKDIITKAYEIRNARVHGNLNKLKKHQHENGDLLSDLGDCLRKTLRKFVEECS